MKRHLLLLLVLLTATGCALSYTKKINGDKEVAFRVMQMAVLENHASAQSTVGIGFSLRFTDYSGAVTPKLDLGYFRHATGLDPILYSPDKRLGEMAIITSADVTGDGIKDEVSFGEATSYESFPVKTGPSMWEMVISELTAMKSSANDADKAKYESNIEFLKSVLGDR